MLDLGITATDLAAWATALDRIDPPQVDVFGKLGYTPTPKQQQFHDATEFAVLFGGSLGGGKTRALTMEVIKACVHYPGLRVGAFRRTYGELKESLLAEVAQVGYAQALGARWIGNEYELRFPNGSVAMFRYAESLNDATRRQGGQYQLLAFDELTLTLPDVVAFLESRLRSGRPDVPVLGIRASANPGGPGHGSVRKRFIDSTNYGTRIIHDERGRTVRFIPSRMEDNPHLNPEYEQDLMALPEVMRQALREGNWDVFAGAMFPELNHDRHVVAPMELPASWRRYNGIDWGYTKPWAVLWAALDEDGRVWVYRELYRAGVGEAQQARMILGSETPDEHVVVRYADDAMWATRGDAKPISDVYAENGVYLTEAGKGPGSRIAGWQRVHSYLDEAPACPHHRAQGWVTCPRLHIFTPVTELYRELRDLPHATKGDPEDADTTASDHAADALRYLLINVGTEPKFHFPPEEKTTPQVLDPQAVGPRPAQPLPRTFGGFPMLNGSNPWG
ncbi:MAG: terminase large subunit domain-containing protein [Pseudonocardiaceae bacterium]